MLVSIHSRFEGRPAGQVCALAPTGYRRGVQVPQFPQAALAGQGTRPLLFPYAQISAVARQGLPVLAVPRGRACWCTSVPAAATRMRIYFPPWPSPLLRAQGRWQHMPCLGASLAAGGEGSVRQLDGHPAWKPAQGNGRRKAFMVLKAEVLSSLFLTKQSLLG